MTFAWFPGEKKKMASRRVHDRKCSNNRLKLLKAAGHQVPVSSKRFLPRTTSLNRVADLRQCITAKRILSSLGKTTMLCVFQLFSILVYHYCNFSCHFSHPRVSIGDATIRSIGHKYHNVVFTTLCTITWHMK